MAQQLLTRADFRDAVRRILGQIPPVDAGGLPGQVPSAYPNPSNPTLNDAIDQALSYINTRTKFTSNYVNVPIISTQLGTSTTQGPLILGMGPLSNADPNYYLPNLITDIRHIEWYPTAGNPTRILPASTSQWNSPAQYFDWAAQYAGIPEWYWIEGYTLNILPWPTQTGYFEVLSGMGIAGFNNDADTLTNLPVDYQNVVLHKTVELVCMTNPSDNEWQTRVQQYGAMAGREIEDLRAWRAGSQQDDQQPALALGSNYMRNSYGTYRSRR